MRFNPYDDVIVNPSTVSSVAIQALSGSSAVNGDKIDTLGWESALIHIRTEIDSGGGTASSVAWALQESLDGSTSWTAALDNTGTTIAGSLNCHTVANDAYARVEGLMLYNTSATASPYGGRKRYLRIVLTPSFTGGSPSIAAYAEVIASPSNAQYPVRTTVSNT